jgi:hypothetical protein
MAQATRPFAVPAAARARALGALVHQGEHALAYADGPVDSLLQGYALEGLEAGERVLVLAGQPGPRSLAARLRANGVAAPRAHPDALRVESAPSPGQLRAHLLLESRRAVTEGYDGLRVAHIRAPTSLGACLGAERALPRRFAGPVTLLCVYGRAALRNAMPEAAWALSKPHARILCL